MEQMHINFSRFNSLIALVDYFDTEDKCKAAIAQQRWGDGEAVLVKYACPLTSSPAAKAVEAAIMAAAAISKIFLFIILLLTLFIPLWLAQESYIRRTVPPL